MDHVELWQIVKSEETVRKAHHQQVGRSVECSAVDLGIILHEEILLDNPPPGLCDVLLRLGIFLGHVFPTEKGSILADSVNL